MYCQNCHREIGDNERFCSFCGAAQNGPRQAPNAQANPYGQPNQQANPYGYQQQPYGQNPPNGAYQQPYGQPNPYGQPAPNDVPNTGLNVLAFFFPIVGLILYLVWKDTTPIKAQAVGKMALIGFIVGIVFSILSYAISFAATLAFL